MDLKRYLTISEEYQQRILENRSSRRKFGSKGDVKGEWRGFHDDELRSLYPLPNIERIIKSRKLRWEEHVPRMEEDRSVFKTQIGKFTGNRLLGMAIHRQANNI